MLADFYVPEPARDAWLSAELSISLWIACALGVLVAAASVVIVRRMRQRTAAMAGWTRRVAGETPAAQRPTVGRHTTPGATWNYIHRSRHAVNNEDTRVLSRVDGSWRA